MAPTLPMLPTLVVGAMTVAGFALTILVLYPGYLTNDATYVHSYIEGWQFGDWQSPLMTVVWGLIDPIAPGSGSMFLLIALLYWLGFGVLALAVAHRSATLAPLVPLLGFTPSAFLLLSMLWRDILFGAVWLLAAALVFLVAERRGALRVTGQALAFLLVAFGVLLRPNSIAAAPLLFTYVLWPTRFEWKRAALLFIPLVIAGYALIDTVYYRVLHAHKDNPAHSLMVFDIGGITYFTGESQFPVTWSADETAMLMTRQCYQPQHWDSYWTLEPCKFVMARLEGHKDDLIFGTPRLSEAWRRAVMAHPLAYLSHRITFMWTFLVEENLTLELWKMTLPDETPLAHNPYFLKLLPWHDTLKSTFLFRTGFWFLLAAAAGAWAWPGRATAAGAFVISVTVSGILYILSFGLLGVASDFRYGYWCVLAALAGLIPARLARRKPPARGLTPAQGSC
jgi:hypothetical protein